MKKACGTWHKTASGEDAPCVTENGQPCSKHPAGEHEVDANGNTIIAYSVDEFLEKKNSGAVMGMSQLLSPPAPPVQPIPQKKPLEPPLPPVNPSDDKYTDVNSVNSDDKLSYFEALAYKKEIAKHGSIRDVAAMSSSANKYGTPAVLQIAWSRVHDENISDAERQELVRSILSTIKSEPYDKEAYEYNVVKRRILLDASKYDTEGVFQIRKSDFLARKQAEREADAKKRADRDRKNYLLNPPAPPAQKTVKKSVNNVVNKYVPSDIRNAPTEEFPKVKPAVSMPARIKPRSHYTDHDVLIRRAAKCGIKHYDRYERVFGKQAALIMLEKAEYRNGIKKKPDLPPRPAKSPALPPLPAPAIPDRSSASIASSVINGVRNDGLDAEREETLRKARLQGQREHPSGAYDGARTETMQPVSDDGTVLNIYKNVRNGRVIRDEGTVNTASSPRRPLDIYRSVRNGKVVYAIPKEYDDKRFPASANYTFAKLQVPLVRTRARLYNSYQRMDNRISHACPGWLRPTLEDVTYADDYWRSADASNDKYITEGTMFTDSLSTMKARMKIAIANAFFLR